MSEEPLTESRPSVRFVVDATMARVLDGEGVEVVNVDGIRESGVWRDDGDDDDGQAWFALCDIEGVVLSRQCVVNLTEVTVL